MRRPTKSLIARVAALVVGTAWAMSRLPSGGAAPASPGAPPGGIPGPQELDRAILRYTERAESDPYSAADRATLATLFLQRARETGSHEDVLRAESEARRSLELRSAHNPGPLGILSMALVEQHRFREAREAALALVATEPERVAYRAHLAEVEMELGNYETAGAMFRALEPRRAELDVAPRLARWLELTGRVDEARSLLHRARDEALRHGELPQERRAWYHMRVGDLELRTGRLDEAEEAFAEGLRIAPDDHRLLAASARLAAARGDLRSAMELGERAIGVTLDPGVLALLSDVHRALGQPDRAAEYTGIVQLSMAETSGPPHREVSLFLLDQGADPAETARRARADLGARRDVYGYDLLAWALHRQGDHRGARAAMQQALRIGTQDPMLHYHAGMIEHALGDAAAARAHLERALEISDRFHPLHADDARRTLRAIRAAEPWYRRLAR